MLLSRWLILGGRTMRGTSSKLFASLGLAVLSVGAQFSQSKDRGVAGTYELLICKGPCSFTDRKNVDRTAVIVIFDQAMKRKDVERIDSGYPNNKHDPARACYVLTDRDGRKAGVTSWSVDGKILSFTLTHSRDSWYSVRVVKGDLLSGVGNLWSAGVAPPPHFMPDTIVGRRRGPADIAVCEADPKLLASHESDR